MFTYLPPFPPDDGHFLSSDTFLDPFPPCHREDCLSLMHLGCWKSCAVEVAGQVFLAGLSREGTTTAPAAMPSSLLLFPVGRTFGSPQQSCLVPSLEHGGAGFSPRPYGAFPSLPRQ